MYIYFIRNMLRKKKNINMKKIKLIVIILFLFVICGCQKVTNEVTMDYSGKINEKVIFEQNTKSISTDEEKVKAYLQSAIDSHKAALNFRKYKSEIIYDKNVSKVVITNDFDNICDYFSKTIFSQYIYKFITCTDLDGYYEIKNNSEYITYKPNYSDWPLLGDVTFKLNLPVKAVENNADNINNNTYIWKFGKGASSTKSLYIKISKKDIEENKLRIIENNKRKKIIERIIIFTILAIITFIIGIFMYKIYKYQNEDKDY